MSPPEKEETPESHGDLDPDNGAISKPLKFRNYKPAAPALKAVEQPVIVPPSSRAEEELKTIDEEVKTADNSLSTDVVDLAPKKANWDLKRDIEKKLKKLDKRTQRALLELLREKIEQEAQGGSDEDEEEDAADSDA